MSGPPVFPRSAAVAILTLLAASPGAAQSFSVFGTTMDASTGDALPAATVRVVGTDRGTIANADGSYRLTLPTGQYRLAFSFIGYKPETLTVRLDEPLRADVRLEPSPIQMAEVVVSGEDPAMAIMRRVIERKARWQEALRTYQFEAFTRQTIRSDTSIASIAETYTAGFWRKGDTLREVIRQKRQTENIKVSRNLASVGGIVNFYDDDVKFAGTRFVGPASVEAFSYYAYRLVQTRTQGGATVFVIELVPRTRITPLFYGTVTVVDEQFSLAGVDVRPNEAWVIPMLPDVHVEYRQQFTLVQDRYWMPADIRIAARIKVDILGFSFPTFGLESVSSIYDYRVNVDLPDSLFTGKRLRQDSSSAVFDSTFWAEREVLPLTREEQEAYERIDSTQTIEKQFQPKGPLASAETSFLQYLGNVDVRFDRVEGWYLGGNYAVDSVGGRWTLGGGAGYAFADHRWQGFASVEALLRDGGRDAAGVEVYTRVQPIWDGSYHFAFENMFSSLLYREDYFDYFRVSGAVARLRVDPIESGSVRLELRHEVQRSVAQQTVYSFFSRGNRYRPQPAAEHATMRSVGVRLRYGGEPVILGLISSDFIEAGVEHADRDLLGGELSFTRFTLSGEYRTATFLRRSFLPATLTIRVHGGAGAGPLPVQRQFSLETQLVGYGPTGVLRAAGVKEFAGDRYVVMTAEHNFRSVLFLWLGIPYLSQRSIETIATVTVARAEQRFGASPLGAATNGWYTEAGIGINRILQILRADLTYRWSSPTGLRLTVAVGPIL